MKTIGLIGGMSWESTVPYYQVINETVRDALGGLHSAKLLLYSMDFAELERYQSSGDWDAAAALMTDAALRLQRAGADFLVICANTMHKSVPAMRAHVSLPILHIAEVTAKRLRESGVDTVGLLGTRYTMTEPFYKDKLAEAGIRALVPEGDDAARVHGVIYDELCRGEIRADSKRAYLEIIERLRSRGAQGIVFGCTEIGLLLEPKDVPLPVFDTTRIHAQEAALFALADEEAEAGA